MNWDQDSDRGASISRAKFSSMKARAGARRLGVLRRIDPDRRETDGVHRLDLVADMVGTGEIEALLAAEMIGDGTTWPCRMRPRCRACSRRHSHIGRTARSPLRRAGARDRPVPGAAAASVAVHALPAPPRRAGERIVRSSPQQRPPAASLPWLGRESSYTQFLFVRTNNVNPASEGHFILQKFPGALVCGVRLRRLGRALALRTLPRLSLAAAQIGAQGLGEAALAVGIFGRHERMISHSLASAASRLDKSGAARP